MGRQRSRAWRVAELLGLVEEPELRPVGSPAWWRRLVLGAGVGAGTFVVLQVLDALQR